MVKRQRRPGECHFHGHGLSIREGGETNAHLIILRVVLVGAGHPGDGVAFLFSKIRKIEEKKHEEAAIQDESEGGQEN